MPWEELGKSKVSIDQSNPGISNAVALAEEQASRYEKIILDSESFKHLRLMGGETRITIEAVGEISFRIDGGIPTKEEGHVLRDGDILELKNYDNILKFKAIAKKNDGATLNITYYGQTVNEIMPNDVNGLALWLDAAQIEGLEDGDPVELWEDKSPYGNNAIRTVSEYPLTYRPNYLNGQPALTFRLGDGENWLKVESETLGNTRLFADESDEFTVFVVARVRMGQYGTLFSKTVPDMHLSGRQFQLFYDRPRNDEITPSIALRGYTYNRTAQDLESDVAVVHVVLWDGQKGYFYSPRGVMELKRGDADELLESGGYYIGARRGGYHNMNGVRWEKL